jgi:hypothetical protein
MRLHFLTVEVGKRLIARGTAQHPSVQRALQEATIVIVAGTTNAYVAWEILKEVDEDTGSFPFHRFFRGVTAPADFVAEGEFPGDVVIEKGRWQQGKTIFDVVDSLGEGDLVVKGANALCLPKREAGVLIGHEKTGTMGAIMQAVVGRRVEMLVPVGLEKRVYTDILSLARMVNSPGSSGPRLFPVTGEVFTEIDALKLLSGVHAELVAAGGAFGAEGGVWLGIEGDPEQIKKAEAIFRTDVPTQS